MAASDASPWSLERLAVWVSAGHPPTQTAQLKLLLICCGVAVLAVVFSILFVSSAEAAAAQACLGLLISTIPLAIRAGLRIVYAKVMALSLVGAFLSVMAMMPAALMAQQLLWFSVLPLCGGLLLGARGILGAGLGAVALVLACAAGQSAGLGLGLLPELPKHAQVIDGLVFLVSVALMTAAYQHLYAQALARQEAAIAARTAFLAQMSHELRTPMNGVIGMVRLLDLDTCREQLRFDLEIIERSGSAMVRLIDELLDQSKLESGRLQLHRAPMSPREVAEDAALLLGLQADAAGIDLRVAVDASVPRWVHADALRLRQVISNLLSNALKFTSSGQVSLRLRWRDGTLHGEVEDSGIGMSPAQLAGLFEPYTQASAETATRYGGTGLVLSISHALCQKMGGTLRARSVLGEGSTFTFSASAPRSAPPASPTAEAELGALAGQVLIVDDNPINLLVSRRLCESMGLTVEVAEHGAAALARLAAGGIDLILMDRMMPVMDGLEATRQLRAWGGPLGQLPVIGLTASVMDADIRACLAAGMDAVLAKPVEQRQLHRSLHQHLPQQRRAASAPAAAPCRCSEA